MTFDFFNLHSEILKAVKGAGFTKPTPVQEQAIPLVMQGKDVRASAQTGTGKTAAFILPALQKLMQPAVKKGHGPRLLILAPTRELAMQIATEASKYAQYLPQIKTVCIYGGAPYPVQNRQLSRPYDILVATPGRLIDHMQSRRIDLSRVEMLVLDEADRMLDMGFIDPVKKIAAATPSSRQTLLFSATLKGSVLKLSQQLLREPEEIRVSGEFEKHENIEQKVLSVDNLHHKLQILHHLLGDPAMRQAVVFTATKRQADKIVDHLVEQGHSAAALHGDMNQRQRTRRIAEVREGKVGVLIATDVAARGLDIQTISHVINFDLPRNTEDYVHRIGRTGRAGAKGIAVSFATPQDRQVLRRIEQFTGQRIAHLTLPGFESQNRGAKAPAPHQRGPKPSPTHHPKYRFKFKSKKRHFRD